MATAVADAPEADLARRRITLIHNADSGDASPTRASLLRLFSDAGYEVRYVSHDADWSAALKQPAEFVVAVGGDGTVGRVIAALAGRKQQVAVLPTGTANNIADWLGIAGDIRDVVRGWPTDRVLPFDVWEVTSGATTVRMVEAIGGGFFAACVARDHELEPPTYILGGPFDRALHMIRERIADEPARAWSVSLDGVDHSGWYIGVEVMNGRHIGPNVPLAADASPGDGMLDVVLMGAQHRDQLEARFDPRACQPTQSGALIRARDARLRPPVGAALHLDGEPWRRSHEDEFIDIRHAGVTLVLGQRSR